MSLPIVHHPDYDAKLPPTHRFPMGKYRALIEVLGERGLIDGRRPGAGAGRARLADRRA